MRPDAPAESGEGFKRSWSEAKEEAGWTEDGQGSGKRTGVSGPSPSWYLQFNFQGNTTGPASGEGDRFSIHVRCPAVIIQFFNQGPGLVGA